MNKRIKILLGLFACAFAFGFSACDNDNTNITNNSSESETTEHEHTFVFEETVQPTCTEQGYNLYLCACGESYAEDYTEVLEHKYVDGGCENCSKDFRKELIFELNADKVSY